MSRSGHAGAPAWNRGTALRGASERLVPILMTALGSAGSTTRAVAQELHALDRLAVVHRLAEPTAAARLGVDGAPRLEVQHVDAQRLLEAGVRLSNGDDASAETMFPVLAHARPIGPREHEHAVIPHA